MHALTPQEQLLLTVSGAGTSRLAALAAVGAAVEDGLPPRLYAPAAIDELRCPAEVRFLVGSSAERVFAGTLAASSVVRVVERQATFVRVALPAATRGWFVPGGDATVSVPAADVASCVSQPMTTDPVSAVDERSPELGRPTTPDTLPGLAASGGDPRQEVHGDVQIGPPTSNVPVPNAAATLAQMRLRARRCYDKGLELDPKQGGAIVIALRIVPDGGVDSGVVTSNQGVSPAVANCIAAGARRLMFASGTTATLQVRFQLTPP